MSCKNSNKNESEVLKKLKDFFSSKTLKRLDDFLSFINFERKFDKESLNTFIESINKKGQLTETVKIKIKKIKDDNFYEFNFPLFTCPATGYKYFYFCIPIELINNDIELQPRPLEFKRLWELYKHLKRNTQLTPSVCRLADNKIYLFDGQHKAAAQLLSGRYEIECKIYINPSIKILKETNLVAHDKLRQMPFFTSVLIKKWASIFSQAWDEYLDLPGEKSEFGFVDYLSKKGKKKNEAISMIESNIYESILEDKSNRFRNILADFGNDRVNPITVNRLRQSFFKKFIANPPLAISLEESDKLRELERLNTIKLLNLIAKYTTLKDNNTNDATSEIVETNNTYANKGLINWDQISNQKIYLNGAFKALCSLIKDTVATILELFDETERNEIFLREISNEDWQIIEKSLETIFTHRIWHDESEQNYNNLRVNNESTVRKYLASRGLSVNWILNYSLDSNNNFID